MLGFEPADPNFEFRVRAIFEKQRINRTIGARPVKVAPLEALTREYQVNFLSPARGERLVAIRKVVRSGRTVTVCSGEAWANDNEGKKLVAAMQATMIAAGK